MVSIIAVVAIGIIAAMLLGGGGDILGPERAGVGASKPKIVWISSPTTLYDYRGFAYGYVSWSVPVRFKNVGSAGEVEFTVTLKGIGTKTEKFYIDAGSEYTLTVYGGIHMRGGTQIPRRHISYPLTIFSPYSDRTVECTVTANEYAYGLKDEVSLGSIKVEKYVHVPEPEWATIEVLSVSPESGSVLNPGDTLTAQVYYKVDTSYIDISKGVKIEWIERLSADWSVTRLLGGQTFYEPEGTVNVTSKPIYYSLGASDKRMEVSIAVVAAKKEDGEWVSRMAKQTFSYFVGK